MLEESADTAITDGLRRVNNLVAGEIETHKTTLLQLGQGVRGQTANLVVAEVKALCPVHQTVGETSDLVVGQVIGTFRLSYLQSSSFIVIMNSPC